MPPSSYAGSWSGGGGGGAGVESGGDIILTFTSKSLETVGRKDFTIRAANGEQWAIIMNRAFEQRATDFEKIRATRESMRVLVQDQLTEMDPRTCYMPVNGTSFSLMFNGGRR